MNESQLDTIRVGFSGKCLMFSSISSITTGPSIVSYFQEAGGVEGWGVRGGCFQQTWSLQWMGWWSILRHAVELVVGNVPTLKWFIILSETGHHPLIDKFKKLIIHLNLNLTQNLTKGILLTNISPSGSSCFMYWTLTLWGGEWASLSSQAQVRRTQVFVLCYS